MSKDRVIDSKTIMIDGKIETIDNPHNLPISLPTSPCKYCFLAEWNDLYGCMVYCCDMSNCIYGEDEL